MSLFLALATVIPIATSACDGFIVSSSMSERRTDAERVTGATQQTTTAAQVSTTMAAGDWRLVWATPTGNERGVFFFKDNKLVDVWGGTPDSEAQAYEWASKTMGAPAALSRCFAQRLVREYR